jgi:hypothetical protein
MSAEDQVWIDEMPQVRNSKFLDEFRRIRDNLRLEAALANGIRMPGPVGHNGALKAETKRLDAYLRLGRHLNGSRNARARGRSGGRRG